MPGGGVPPPPSTYMGASLEAEPAVGPEMGAGWKHCGGEVLPSTKPEAVRETHKAERLGESDRDREMGERQRERESARQSPAESRALRDRKGQ